MQGEIKNASVRGGFFVAEEIRRRYNAIIMMELQLFVERDLKNQTDRSLRKGIKSYEKVIEVHKAKIQSPKMFYAEWEKLSEREKEGCIRHWRKEIEVAQESIESRQEELKKRSKKKDESLDG